MKYISICAILASLVFQNTATAASAYQSVNTPPSTLQEFVERYKSATVLYSDFLDGYLISGILDLSSFEHLCAIGDGFLRGQKTLTGIILPANLTRIGSDFLVNCEKLKEIDLSALKNVRHIGPNFLWGCKNLMTVILPFNKAFESVEFPPHVNIFFPDDMHMKTPSAAPYATTTAAPTLQEFVERYKNATVLDSDFTRNVDTQVNFLDLSSLKHVSVIGDVFLNRSLIERIVFPPNVRTIGINFLSQCANLNEVDLSAFLKVITIEDGFFSACANLKKVNMPECMDVTHIKNDFFSYCENLTEIDLSAFKNVRHIGDYFLGWCENLREIDFSALENVIHIGHRFLTGCTKLEKVILPSNKAFKSVEFPTHVNIFFADDMHMRAPSAASYATMPPLPAPYPMIIPSAASYPATAASTPTTTTTAPSAAPYATTTAAPTLQEFVERYKSATVLDSDFLKGMCISGVLDLSSLKHVSVINDYFLCYSELKSIIFPPNVRKIGGHFLHSTKLKKVDLSAGKNVTSIGHNFLSQCANLNEVDFSPLTEVTHIGGNFLRACKALEEFYWHDFTRLIIIEDGFLAACENLWKVNMTGFIHVTHIKNQFLSYCTKLREIDLSAFKNVIHIEGYFLGRCENLTILDLSALEKLKHIGPNFLKGCINLTDLGGLSALTNVTDIGSDFLSGCENLKELDLSGLINLRHIEHGFLEGCTKLEKVILPLNNMAFNNVQFPPSVTNFPGIAVITKDFTIEIHNPRAKNILSITCEEYIFRALIIDLQGLRTATELCSKVLAGFARLRNVDLSPLENVNKIGDEFLSGCRSIESLTI
ncbi:MAG: hypothetical protein CNLJKLNK_00211 [Holosporales bacterium]